MTVQDPEERTTKSIVRIRDNETVVIGGLIRNDLSQTESRIPVLSSIPILGALFKHKDVDANRERELIVFITPHIIKDRAIELAQTKKVSLPEREQSAFSGIDRNAIIEANLNTFERK